MERFSDQIEIGSVSQNRYVYEAPELLRIFVYELLYMFMPKSTISAINDLNNFVCTTTYIPPAGNWNEPYLSNEIKYNILNAEWQYVYDIIERFHGKIKSQESKCGYISEVNRFFLKSGGGWRLTDEGSIVFRGGDSFNLAVRNVANGGCISSSNVENEIKEAIADISKRPDPDITGAIQHSMAGLECLCRKIGCSKSTLGDLLQKHKGIIPPPLNDAVKKMWGYASENGRHIVDKKKSGYKEAELVVSVSCALINYLSDERFKQIEDLPF